MKTSTQLRLEATDFSSELTFEAPRYLLGTVGLEIKSVRLPTFGNYVYAATARRAGRVNAAAISDAEQKALLDERQTLLDRILTGTANRKDEIRLEYVRWSLDRIEDAKHGDQLDRLEEVVVRYEHFLKDLQSLQEQLEAGSKSK